MLLTLKPLRLVLAAKINALLALLATLEVVGVRAAVAVVIVPETANGTPLIVETL
jgi:hypothetical protein